MLRAKIIPIMSIVIILFGLFSCSKKPETEIPLNLFSENMSNYTIIRSENASSKVVDATVKFRQAFNDSCGISIPLQTDWIHPQVQSESEFEILIGSTNRAESTQASAGLLYEDIVITSVNKKLVIIGGSDEATAKAVDYFIEKILTGQRTTLQFSKADAYTFKKEYPSFTINGVNLSDYKIIVPSNITQSLRDDIVEVSAYLRENYGVNLKIETDKTAEAANEILFGLTNRQESKKYTTEIIEANTGYTIAVEGSKLVLLCNGNWSADKMTEALFKNIESMGAGDIALDSSNIKADSDLASLAKNARADSTDIRIMSNNVNFILDDKIKRFEMLADTYIIYRPDVIGLQEISKEVKDMLFPLISKYYAAVDAKTSSSVINATQIVYLKDKFTVVDSGFEPLVPASWTKSITYAVLKENSTGRIFAVLNTHFSLDPDTGREDGYKLRAANVDQMFDIINRIRAKHGNIPVATTGDYFDGKPRPTYERLVSGGLLDTTYEATVSADINKGTFHQVGKSDSGTMAIDFVFVLKDTFKTLSHRIVINKYTVNGTDHYPVFADLKFPS